ncbi:MAG TPA: type IV pilus secretin PilQ, partial [Nitrospiraceae bacterium]|nr:type IV pilus secretin PilQ [Nitrospiraceae bacterium]
MSRTDISPKTVVSILLLQGLVSCTHLPAESVGTDQKTRSLEHIGVTDLHDRLRVEVDGGERLAYSVSTSMAPASITVDLPGLSSGKALRRLEINKPPLLQMVPTEVSKPRAGVQLVFTLTTPVKPDIRVEGTRLIIDFPKPTLPAASASVTQEAGLRASSDNASSAPVAIASSRLESGTAAKTLTKVEVQRGEGAATVIIFGDGRFSYDARLINQSRLIVDLANVASSLRSPVLPVDHPLLKQIRIGRHSDKVRLVFDLPKPAGYSVEAETSHLSVRLTSLAESARRENKAKLADSHQSDAPLAHQAGGQVRVAPSGRVPFPERLAMIEANPRLAQMAPDAKTMEEPEGGGVSRYVGRRISLDFQAADISNVLRLIAEVSGFNIVVGEGVKAKVTMKLVSVPWDQALDMLLKMNNLGMIKEGNIVWIDTLANLAKQQDEEARTKESKIKAENLVSQVFYIRNIPAQELQTTLLRYMTPRGILNFNQASNALVIRDTESQIGILKQLIESLDLQVPQVQIEARIVQADTSYSRSLGIQWGIQNLNTMNPQSGVANFVGGNTGAFGAQTSDFLVNLPAAVTGLTSVPAAGFTYGKLVNGALLDMRLSAGELLGLTKVIAAPKITTLDKRDAKISQGESIPFQTTSLQGTQTTFVDANLELQVTPQITSRDPKEEGKLIMLKVRATRNAVGARSNPAGPSIDKREATTQIMV